MAIKSYAEKLKDPRWQKKRLEVLEDNDFTCESCGDNESTLHVHHKMYAKGRDPWEYSLDQYAVLCDNCHSFEHSKEFDVFFEVMSRLPIDGPFNKTEIAYIVAGLIGVHVNTEHSFHSFLFQKGILLRGYYMKWIGANKQ